MGTFLKSAFDEHVSVPYFKKKSPVSVFQLERKNSLRNVLYFGFLCWAVRMHVHNNFCKFFFSLSLFCKELCMKQLRNLCLMVDYKEDDCEEALLVWRIWIVKAYIFFCCCSCWLFF